jgi:hypothetical protein
MVLNQHAVPQSLSLFRQDTQQLEEGGPSVLPKAGFPLPEYIHIQDAV